MKKKSVIIAISILISIGLVACDPGHYQHNLDELKEKVVRVELIWYDNLETQEWNGKKDNALKQLDFDKMEVVEVLDEEKIYAFLTDLCEELYWYRYNSSNSPVGFCIRLMFQNGDFELICVEFSYSGIFNSSGEMIEFLGFNSWDESVNGYFEMLNEN